MQKDRFEYEGTLTNGEARALIATIADCAPEDVRSWVIIAHVHPGQGANHETRAITNCPLETIPRLLMEGLDAL